MAAIPPDPHRPIPSQSRFSLAPILGHFWEWLFPAKPVHELSGATIKKASQELLLRAIDKSQRVGCLRIKPLHKMRETDFSLRLISKNCIIVKIKIGESKTALGEGASKSIKAYYQIMQQDDGSWEVKDSAFVKQKRETSEPTLLNPYLSGIEHENLSFPTREYNVPNSATAAGTPRKAYVMDRAVVDGTNISTIAPNIREKYNLCLQLLRGLQCLHNHGLVHHDLRPANFLIFREADRLVAKIADCDEVCPESLSKTRWTMPEDILTMGAALHQMLNSSIDELTDTQRSQLNALIEQMTHKDPSQRPTINAAISTFQAIIIE